MPRRSLARTLQVALLGLTVVLTTIAALGVAGLYAGRQDYEDRLTEALGLQVSAGRLLAAGVVEEATLRLLPASVGPARSAYDRALASARAAAGSDRESLRLLDASAAAQARLRLRPGSRSAPLAARSPLVALSARQGTRIADARDDASSSSRRALIAIVVGGVLALGAALALVAGILAAVRQPLDALVTAAGRLAAGDAGVRVLEGVGPEELRVLGGAFNAMAAEVQAATARVEAERRNLAVTVRSLGDALVITDADGTVTAANPRARVLLPEAVEGEKLDEPVALRVALAGEVELVRENRTYSVTAAPLDADDAAGHVWTIRDVTERARLEALKSDFVATASHELRSPMTSIKGFVELLEASQGLTARQREWVEILHLSTDRLVELVDDLLDVTRLEAGQVEVRRRPTDVALLAAEVGALMRPRLDAAGQRFSIDVADNLPPALLDPGRVRQVLVNLLTNGLLYAGDGSHLEIRAEADDHTLVLTVADDGRGMTAERATHVFDRFYRGAEREGPAGTGLGLAIVSSLVELHRGSIEVVTAPAQGTAFHVRFPGAIETGAPGASRAALRGRRLLVCDDEPQVAALIAGRLTAQGAEVHVVDGGRDALRLLRAERFDGMTLDVLMPEMSGFEVLRELRDDPVLCGLPVVVVSVFSGREAVSGEWTVAKPIDPDELVDALGAAILAARVRVLVVGRHAVRPALDAVLTELSIDHEWAYDADDVAARCSSRYYEVALVDTALPDPAATLAGLDLRGRRRQGTIVTFRAPQDEPGFVVDDTAPVALADAGAAVVGLLSSPPHLAAGG